MRNLAWLLVPLLAACGSKSPEPERHAPVAFTEPSDCVVLAAPTERSPGQPRFRVCAGDLSGEPAWEGPESAAPPISTADAAEVARRELARYAGREAWRLDEVTLQRLRIGAEDRWVYVTTWRRSQERSALRIPVLLSGQAVRAETEP